MSTPNDPLLTTTLVDIAGHRVRMARMGAGDPLLLLHGYPDNLQIWHRLAPRLAADHEAIALDWPGMGESDAWRGGATPGHMADRLLSVLDALGLGAVTLVAHDMGAPPALVLASRHPERVRRLVVMNSLVVWDEATSWEIRLLRRFSWNRVLLRHAGRLVFSRAVRTSLPARTRMPGVLREELWRSFRRPEVRAFVAKMCAGYQGTLPQFLDVYSQVRAPTLLLWGDRDRHFPPTHARRLAALLPAAEVRIITDGEHWMAWHRAEDVHQALTAFLGRGPLEKTPCRPVRGQSNVEPGS